jgi:hypothetical protein
LTIASAALGSSPISNVATPANTNAAPIAGACQMDRLVFACITASKETLSLPESGLTDFSADARRASVNDEETGERRARAATLDSYFPA